MGIKFDTINHAYFVGTTAATANAPQPSKALMPDDMMTAADWWIPLTGEGVYLKNATERRDGLNFPISVVEVDSDDPICVKICKLTSTKFVVMSFVDSGSLECTVVDVTGQTPTAGAITTINSGDTDSANIVSIGTAGTHFAVVFRDTTGSSYVYGKICSVSGTTITQGSEKVLDGTDAALENTAPAVYGVCEPRAGVLYFTWCDSDDDIASVAAPYSGITIGTLGSQVEISSDAGTELACCKIAEGSVLAIFQDVADSEFLHGRVATVSAAGAIGTYGTEKDLVSTGDAKVTYISCQYVEQDKAIVFGEDVANDPCAIVCTISGTTITVGTFKTFLAGTVTDVGGDMIDNTQGIIKWDNGTDGNCVRFTISGTTISADSVIDKFTNTSATVGGGTGGLVCTPEGKCVIAYEDADNDIGCVVGKYHEDKIIDVRASGTGAVFKGRIFPNFNPETDILV